MTAPSYSCPSCHVVFTPTAPGPQVVCPVCDTRFSPGAAPAPPAPPAAQPPARSWPVALGVLVALLLAAGAGLAIWRPGHAPGPQAAQPAPVAERAPQPPAPEATADPELLAPVPDVPLPPPLSLPKEFAPAPAGPPPAAAKRPPAPAPKQVAAAPALQRPIIQAVSRALGDQINRAIDRGQAYLQDQADKFGLPQRFEGLLGLTLLECGVPRNDKFVLRIAESLRSQANQLTGTYELSTAIFFLDRLGDRADDALIRTFAERLAAGQFEGGTWTYNCPVVPGSMPVRRRGHGDHSNTQFATLALWVSRRHGAGPEIRMALARVERHFRSTQAEDGSWSYYPTPARVVEQLPDRPAGPPGRVQSPQVVNQEQWRPLTNLGWAGNGRQSWSGFDAGKIQPMLPPGWPPDRRADPRHRPHAPRTMWGTTSTCAGLLALAVGHALDARVSRNPLNDPAVAAAVRYLGGAIAKVPRLPPPEVHRRAQLDGRNDTYTLWSVERVGTLFGLQRLGDRAWYPWAAEWLLATQYADGSWQHGFGPIIDTCFALLVLRRSNLAPDLTYALSNPGRRPAAAPPRRPLTQGLAGQPRPPSRPQTPEAPASALAGGQPPRSTPQPGPQHPGAAPEARERKTPE